MNIEVRGGFGRFLSGIGRALRRGGEEATAELAERPREEPRSEAEEALWQAMGWDETAGGEVAEIMDKKLRKALEEA